MLLPFSQSGGTHAADLAPAFFVSALIYGVAGLLLGLDMGIRHDHAELPTHAHIMVVGWVSFAIFAFFYHWFGHAVPPLLASLHFWLAQLSLLILVLGLVAHLCGARRFEPLAAVGSIGYIASFAVFAVGAFIAMRAPASCPLGAAPHIFTAVIVSKETGNSALTLKRWQAD